MATITLTCQRCSVSYETYRSRANSRFCSLRCVGAARAVPATHKTCLRCGTRFTRPGADRGQKFCSQRCADSVRGFKHGGRRTSEYGVWRSMIQRCTNPNATKYEDYGGRGIRVCNRWRDSFEAFLADVGPRPTPSHEIDRHPNNDGNYEPGNVRWATRKEQMLNTRASVRATYDGREWTVEELAKHLGITAFALYGRVRNGRPLDAPLRPRRPGVRPNRKLWLAYAEPLKDRVMGLWLPAWHQLPADTASALYESMRRTGYLAFLGNTEDEAMGRLQDAQGICCVCADGRGKVQCSGCEQTILEQRLEQAVQKGRAA